MPKRKAAKRPWGFFVIDVIKIEGINRQMRLMRCDKAP